jgi:hypothetical protein
MMLKEILSQLACTMTTEFFGYSGCCDDELHLLTAFGALSLIKKRGGWAVRAFLAGARREGKSDVTWELWGQSRGSTHNYSSNMALWSTINSWGLWPVGIPWRYIQEWGPAADHISIATGSCQRNSRDVVGLDLTIIPKPLHTAGQF